MPQAPRNSSDTCFAPLSHQVPAPLCPRLYTQLRLRPLLAGQWAQPLACLLAFNANTFPVSIQQLVFSRVTYLRSVLAKRSSAQTPAMIPRKPQDKVHTSLPGFLMAQKSNPCQALPPHFQDVSTLAHTLCSF